MQSSSFSKNAFDISPEIQSLAEVEELGELRKVYPVWKAATGFWNGGQMCVAFGVMGLLIDASIITATFFSSRPLLDLWADLWKFILALTISAILLLVLGSYMLLSRRIYAHWQVSLWQDGFIYEKKRTRQVFRWNQIENVQGNIGAWQHGPALNLYTYTVRRQDGDEVQLGSVFSDFPEFIDKVLEESARHLASQELNIASPNTTWTFTALKLDRQGISDGQEIHSWQDIQEFVTKNGTVTLREKIE